MPRGVRGWVGFALLPALALVAFAVLVALDVSGSSVGVLRLDRPDPDLLAGTPRAIRSDEWSLVTPLAQRQVVDGFPAAPYVGLTPTQLAAVAAGPTRGWVEAFRPQNWGYLVLGASRGLAWHWWFGFLVGVLGVYLLVWWLTRSVAVAVALAVAGAFSPYTAWWSTPTPALPLGWACVAATAALVAARGPTWRRAGAGAVAGLALVALALTLYPPWIVTPLLVLTGLVVGRLVDLRVPWRRLLLPAGAALLAAGVPLALWYAQNRETITLTAQTIYPGQRYSDPGQGSVAWLLDAPLNWWLSGPAGLTLSGAGLDQTVNQSEVSATWLPAPVGAVLLGLTALVLWRSWRVRRADPSAGPRRPHPRIGGALVGVLVPAAVLLAWALLPLPSWTGRLLLDRVPGYRVPLALGLAALLVVALASVALRRMRRRLLPAVLLGAAVAASGVVTVLVAGALPWEPPAVPAALPALSGAAVALGFALVVARGVVLRWLGVALLVGVCGSSWAVVNPLYRGVGAYGDDPLVLAMRQVVDSSGGQVRAAAYGSRSLTSLLNAAGVEAVSSTTFIPNVPLMTALLPTQRAAWNNFASYVWEPQPEASTPWIEVVRGTSAVLHVAPCSELVHRLGVTWLVSRQELTGSCLQPVDTIGSALGPVHRYRVLP